MFEGTTIPPIRTVPLSRGGATATLQLRGVVLSLPVDAETVGQFATSYFDENGRRIPVIPSMEASNLCLGIWITVYHYAPCLRGQQYLQSELSRYPGGGLQQHCNCVEWCCPCPSCLNSQELRERARCCNPCQ